MRLQVKFKNGTAPDALKRYAEKKVSKLERYFHAVQTATMEQTLERGQHIVELNVEGDGVLLRSEERCNDLYAAVDNVVDKMERQVKRFKTRQRRGHQRPGPVKAAAAEHVSQAIGELATEEEEAYEPQVTRRKRFPMKPMSAEEAARQMELLSHNFFLFHNEDTGAVSVLYRRSGGDYGLIEPET